MATNNKFPAPPELVSEKYAAWKKEIKILEMVPNVDIKKRVPTVSLSINGKAREVALKMDADKLDIEERMKLLYGKLDS